MTAYTSNQQRYIDTFMRQIDAVLTHFLETGEGVEKQEGSIADMLDMASNAVDTLSNIAVLAGVVAVVGTGATILVPLSAALGVLKAGEEGVKFVWRHTVKADIPFSPDEARRDEIRLSLYSVLCEVAYLAAVRYGHMIDVQLKDQIDVDDFARDGAARAIKQLVMDLKTHVDLPPTLMAQTILDSLLKSVQLSAMHKQQTVTFKDNVRPQSHLSMLFVAYAKWCYARPRQVVIVKSGPNTLSYMYYATPNEKMFLKKDTTLPEYGYITVPASLLTSKDSAVNAHELKPLKNNDIVNVQQLQRDLCSYYPVSRDEVCDYLNAVRAAMPSKPGILSLNEYLNLRFGARLIAECHDDRLKNLDLHGGNFSDVYFSRVNLSECLLHNTFWKNALLNEACFDSNDLTAADFQHAHAEKSQWRNLQFTGNFFQTRLNGAKFRDVTILSSALLIECQWDLAEMVNVKTETQQSLQQHFAEQLEREHLAREQSEHVMSDRLQTMQDEQGVRWDQQQVINQQLSSRVEAVEPIPDLFKRLRQYWDIEISTPAFQESKKSYVELNVASMDNNATPLSDRLDQFLADTNPFFLVHGEVGSGKSLSVCLWQEELMNHYHQTNDWLPVYIKLKRVHDASIDNFLLGALATVLNNEQMGTLMEHFRCLIVFDGLDECSLTEQRFVLEECSNLNSKWKKGAPKILLLAQTRYLYEKDYHVLLRLNAEIKFPSESECVIQSLTEQQVASYVAMYDTQDSSFSSRYADFKEHELAIRAMAKSPIMLHIICEVLRVGAGRKLPSTRLEFYDAFFLNWFEHVKRKLPDITVDYDDFEYFIQEMAMSMFELGKDYIERPYPHKNHSSLLAPRFYDTHSGHPVESLFEDPRLRNTRHLTPLSMTVRNKESSKQGKQVLRYEFTHLSFEHYALAKRLLSILLSLDEESDLDSDSGLDAMQEARRRDWNHGFLADAPDVLDFLHDFLKTHSDTESVQACLLDMVLASKDNTKMQCAASNAMTLLVRLGFDFSTRIKNAELSGIHIPKADLTRALLAYVDLSNSDLSEVCFYEAVLIHCNMQGATLTKTRFSNALTFMYPDVPPETFAVCPSLLDDRVAHDVTPKFGNQKYKISIAQISDGVVLAQWDAHAGKIRCMAWTVSGELNRLASAGDGGTVRVWNVSDRTRAGKQVVMMQVSKWAILTLAWAAEGNLLALGGEDKTVQILDINNKAKLFQSEAHGLQIHCVIWGQKRNILISGGDDSILRLWDVTHPVGGVLTTEQISLPRGNMGPIYSLALSPDELQMASGCGNAIIYIRDLTSIYRKDITLFKVLAGHRDVVTSLTWGAAGLVSASYDNTVRIWDTKNQQCTSVFQGHDTRIKHVVWMPNGRHVMSGGGGRGRMLSIWNGAAHASRSLEQDFVTQVTSLAPRGDLLAVGGIDGRVSLWPLNALTFKKNDVILTCHDEPVQQIAWSNDGKYVASMANKRKDKTIHIVQPDQFDRQTGQLPNNPNGILKLANDSAWFNHLIWLNSPETPHWLVAGASDGAIYIWDIPRVLAATQPLAAGIKLNAVSITGGIQCVACSPSDPARMQLAAASGNTITIWDLNPHQNTLVPTVVQQFKHLERPIVNLAWSPDGRFLVSTDDDGVSFIWNTDTWLGSRLFDEPSENKWVFWAVISSKQWLVSGNTDKIVLWDATENPTWGEPHKQIPWGANVLAFNAPHFVMARRKGIYVIPFIDLVKMNADGAEHPVVKVINHDFWAQQSNLLNTKDLALPTKRFMEKHGATTSAQSTKQPNNGAGAMLRSFSLFRHADSSPLETPAVGSRENVNESPRITTKERQG